MSDTPIMFRQKGRSFVKVGEHYDDEAGYTVKLYSVVKKPYIRKCDR